jgi:UDP-N-acetylglucosamine acyltransferase
MPVKLHLTAVIEPGAVLDDDVTVGPFCHVGAGVVIGAGSELVSHVTVLGPTRIGQRNRIHAFACVGAAPQDKTYRGEPTELLMGDDNEVREQVTIHRGTAKGGGVTRVGSRCLFMVGSHVAHDCQVGDDVTLTNLATLGGHVTVEANAVLGGHVAVAPFVRLGRGCFLAGGARVERDVPPFVIASGDRARVRALNKVGLERMGVPVASRRALERAFRMIWKSGAPIANGIQAARLELGEDPWVTELCYFDSNKSSKT